MAFPLHARIRSLARRACLTGLCCVGLLGNSAFAGTGLPEFTQPAWKDLGAGQQAILAPLAKEWDAMEPFRRKKWLGIAARYESLSPDEQARLQDRMHEWAMLAPEERKLAREKYKKLKNVKPEQRESLRQNWEDYKSLPAEEKQRLKDKAVRRPPVSTIPPPATAPGLKRAKP